MKADMNELDGLGEKLIGEIVKQGMFTIKAPDPEVEHLFVWNGNSSEQLECVVRDFLTVKASDMDG